MSADSAPPNTPQAFVDDRPIPLRPGELPAEMQAPLARFKGAEPPAPAWFVRAVAQAPERRFVQSAGVPIELLTWGEVGRPGIMLLHGNSAHADWWSFIAPLLAEDYRVASMSLAGMGASGWRDSYSFAGFAADAEACARAAGLYEGGRKPVYVGHSFGGAIVYYTAAKAPEQMHAAILVDTGFGGPADAGEKEAARKKADIRAIPTLDRPSRVYPTLAAALARFRFMPPQPVENAYIADFMARRSLKAAPLPDGSGQGWTWRFDPTLWDKLDRTPQHGMDGRTISPSVPTLHIVGELSTIASVSKSAPPGDLKTIIVPDANHHVMVDQPLALVATLRGLLAVWPA